MEVLLKPPGTLGEYKFVVIFARYRGEWIYVRHTKRDTWEIPGGHVESAEAPSNAARRELYEETGAVEFDSWLAFDYAVCWPDGDSNGQVYLAEVRELGPLPKSEIGEICFHGGLPEKLTYPAIQPVLHDGMREYLIHHAI